MKCHQKDDFNIVLENLIQSDAYAVAAPTYFLGANASLKRFLDRGFNFYAHIDELWGKPAVGIAIAGTKGMEGYTKLVVESFIKLTMGDLRGSAVIYGKLPGEIFLENNGKEIAKRLAEALVFGKKEDLHVPSCPLCGGETFRFLPDGKVQCMLCSNTGHYEWKGDHIELHIALGEHPLFWDYEGAKRHANLLREMKENFLARRKELKAITQHYSQEGIWIQPERCELNGNQTKH
jgi:multimeric flavodoxin WrbA